MKRMKRALLTVSVLISILSSACGDDDDDYFVSTVGPLVGGPCIDNLDCVSGSFCAEGGDFPGGTCTVPCGDHGDCPGPSLCIDKMGGMCALACYDDRDCRRGYKCKEENDRARNTKSPVCIK